MIGWLRVRQALQRPAGLLAIALLLQLILLGRAFGRLLTEPGQHLLIDGYDGLKNYFTFQAYVQQQPGWGLRWFGMMNYPFGDYIFYTDNTPLLAVPVRLFSQYVYDVRPYALDVYHGLLLAGLLLSTALLVGILRRLLHYRVLVVVFAVVLPWLNPQTARLVNGHFNLSYSWVLLLAIWGLLRLHEKVQAGQPVGRLLAGLVAGLTLAGFVHLYYLPIVGLLVVGFGAAWLLPGGQWRRQGRTLLAGAALALAPVVLTWLVVRATDAYYALRLATPTGFNFEPWALQVLALLKPPASHTTHFLVEPAATPTYESQMYLGAFVLFALLITLLVWVARRAAVRQLWQEVRATPAGRFAVVLLAASAVGLLVAFGTRFSVGNGQLVVTNYFSAFYYLQKISGSVAHFRAVARFSWPFFWAVNLLVLVAVDYWLRAGRGMARWVLAVGLVVLALLDTRDTLKFYRKSLVDNPFTGAAQSAEVNQLLAAVRPQEYQAIVPVPFFHVGSEDMDLTLDDDNAHSRRCYQLALRTNLPLMASKMSRTPPLHARQLRTLFDPSGPEPSLRARLRTSGKPLLVLLDQRYYDGPDNLAARQTNASARQLVEAGARLTTQQPLTLLAQAGTLRLYRWEVR